MGSSDRDEQIDVVTGSPVFVTGYQRSGTTLLGNIVDRHSSIAVFIESFFIPRYFFTQVLFWPLRKDANYLRLAKAIVGESSSKKNNMVLHESVLSDKGRTVASLIDTLFFEWAKSRGKERWGDKSPGYISKMSILNKMFPDARFVHIIRDGRDVWLSLKKLGWESDVVKVANDWAKTVAKARSFGASMDPSRYLEIQYERLVAQPDVEARRVAEFLDEKYDPEMIEPDADGPGNPALIDWPGVNQAIDSANVQKWKKQLTDDELAAFDVCARDVLESLGYPVSSEDQPLSKSLAIKSRAAWYRLLRPVELLGRALRLFGEAASRRVA